MVKLFQRIKIYFSESFLFQVASYNGLNVFIKLISSFVVSKVSALYLGPSGYALVGNFKNILQGVLGISAVGFESGIIKYVAENKNNQFIKNKVISSAVIFSFMISIVLGLLLFFLAPFLGTYFLQDANLVYVFKILGILFPLISINFLIAYIFNGLQRFKLYTYLIALSNILNALITFLMVMMLSLEGALLASLFVPIVSFLMSMTLRDVRLILVDIIKNITSISLAIIKSMSKYVMVAVYSSILISVSYLLIRSQVINVLGADTAGLWEAMNKISMTYMIFFSSLFTLYLLPQLSQNQSVHGFYKIMRIYFSNLIPFIIVLFFILFLIRVFLIKLFLTNEFLPVENFFYLQLIGDFIKVVAFSLAYQFHAKKMFTAYLVCDSILYLSFYFLSIFFINIFKLEGVFYAYILSTVLYLVSVTFFIYFRLDNYLNNEKQMA